MSTETISGAAGPAAGSGNSDRPRPRTRRSWTHGLYAACGGAGFLLIWQVLTWVGQFDPVVLPGPVTVAGSLMTLLGSAGFWVDLRTSLTEFVLGFLIGEILGLLAGALIHESLIARRLTAPLVETFRFIVPFAWIPLAILWFGPSLVGKVWLVVYAVFFVTVVSTADSLANVDPVLVRAATMLGMNRRRRLVSVKLRAATPVIANAATAAAGLGWIAVVAAEYIGSSSGLGYLIINASSTLQTSTVLAGMVVIGLVGAGVSLLIRMTVRHALDYTRRTS